MRFRTGPGASGDLEALQQSLAEAGIDLEALEGLRSLGPPASPAPEPPRVPADSKILLHAALSGSFLPSQLVAGGGVAGPALDALLAASETVLAASGRAWRLRPDVRQETLAGAAAAGELAPALDRLPALELDHTGEMLRRVLGGDAVDPESLPLDSLEDLALVVEWLTGSDLGSPLPPLAEVRRVQRRRELIEPFLTLVGRPSGQADDGSGDRFVGREKETERLRAYVGVVSPDRMVDRLKRGLHSLWASVTPGNAAPEPLLVQGGGGVGKSTLIAKFILDHAMIPGLRLPFMYLDFDRATITPREPLQLLIDLALQMSVWLPEAEPLLLDFRHQLRRRIEEQARHAEHKERERHTRSELRGFCERFRLIVEQFNRGDAPVVLLLDTFELVQYSEEAIEGVQALIQSMRFPEGGPWANLRVVVSGRGDLNEEIQTGLAPIDLGPLGLKATEELIAFRAAKAGIGLSGEQVRALARALASSPLDVIIVTRWLTQNLQDAPGLVEELLADPELASPDRSTAPTALAEERVRALLMGRMIKHIADRHVRSLALPGFVVRAISADVIGAVMIPAGAEGRDAPEGPPVPAEKLFRRLRRERWLVSEDGDLLRHRPEVRRAMLRLMRERDREAFYRTNQRAIDFFLARSDSDGTARAEAIYHLLLAETPQIEQADRLWREECGSILAGGVEDLAGEAQDYLRTRLGRRYSVPVMAALPEPVLQSVLEASAPRILKRLGPDEYLKLLALRPDARAAGSKEIEIEALYRAGHWPALLDRLQSDLATLVFEPLERLLSPGAPPPDAGSVRTLRQLIQLGTRDAWTDDLWPAALNRMAESGDGLDGELMWEAAALVACWQRRTLGIAPSGAIFRAVTARLASRPLDLRTRGGAPLRILALLEPPDQCRLLSRVDFTAHLATVSAAEFALFREMSERMMADPPQFTDEWVEAQCRQAIVQAGELIATIGAAGTDTIVLDPQITRPMGAITQAFVEYGGLRVASAARRLLALTYPDWLEPLGLALDRAYGGEVPTRLRFLRSIDRLLGSESGGRRASRGTTGHRLLSLADEASQLPDAVAAYSEHLGNGSPAAADFLHLAERLTAWRCEVEPVNVIPAS